MARKRVCRAESSNRNDQRRKSALSVPWGGPHPLKHDESGELYGDIEFAVNLGVRKGKRCSRNPSHRTNVNPTNPVGRSLSRLS